MRLLRTTTDLAVEASLTEALQSGAKQAVRQYNACLARLEAMGELPAGFFEPLAADTAFDEVGVASAYVVSYLGESADGNSSAGVSKQINVVKNVHNSYDGSPPEIQIGPRATSGDEGPVSDNAAE